MGSTDNSFSLPFPLTAVKTGLKYTIRAKAIKSLPPIPLKEFDPSMLFAFVPGLNEWASKQGDKEIRIELTLRTD